MTEFEIAVKHGEAVYTSIRRFVIVAVGRGHCQCLYVTTGPNCSFQADTSRAIKTYGHQGTGKYGVNRDDHAIIYTGNTVPRELDGEPPLTKTAIQVIPNTHRDKLDPESRLDYAKHYTVEHNVKVFFIVVHKSSADCSFGHESLDMSKSTDL